jgi:hypothetical protein
MPRGCARGKRDRRGIVAVQTYQALLARQESVERVRKMRQTIERAGGRIVIEPPTPTGMVVVMLTLPDPYHPRDYFPDLPFYVL